MHQAPSGSVHASKRYLQLTIYHIKRPTRLPGGRKATLFAAYVPHDGHSMQCAHMQLVQTSIHPSSIHKSSTHLHFWNDHIHLHLPQVVRGNNQMGVGVLHPLGSRRIALSGRHHARGCRTGRSTDVFCRGSCFGSLTASRPGHVRTSLPTACWCLLSWHGSLLTWRWLACTDTLTRSSLCSVVRLQRC
jgi:hypothetical protein